MENINIQNPVFDTPQNQDITELQNPDLAESRMTWEEKQQRKKNRKKKIEDDVCYNLKPPPTAQLNLKVMFINIIQ